MAYSSAYLKNLKVIYDEDIKVLHHKDKTYQGSWNKRDYSAFENLARKWDRIHVICSKHGWSVFAALGDDSSAQGHDGTILAEIRDLRRYLALVEAAFVESHPNLPLEYNTPGTPDDGGHHDKDSGLAIDAVNEGVDQDFSTAGVRFRATERDEIYNLYPDPNKEFHKGVVNAGEQRLNERKIEPDDAA